MPESQSLGMLVEDLNRATTDLLDLWKNAQHYRAVAVTREVLSLASRTFQRLTAMVEALEEIERQR